jgi:deazaflavin-dependent oxidoreductase (nitroreductase family)
VAASELERLAGEDFCYVTTVGRRTGRPHTIEIWFAACRTIAYILLGAGERSDTVRNIRANPAVGFRVGERSWDAEARVVTDAAEAALARRLVPEKYAAHEEGLEEWAAEALPVAIEHLT